MCNSSKMITLNVTHQGDLYRIVLSNKIERIRVFERGLNRGWELDFDELPHEVQEIIRESFYKNHEP